MKNIKLLIGFIIICTVLLSAGCQENTPPDNGRNTKDNEETPATPTPATPTPKDKKLVATIYEKMKKDPNLKGQIEHIKITYAKKTLTLSGYIYGNKNLLTFYKIIFEVIEGDNSPNQQARKLKSETDNSNSKMDDSKSPNEGFLKIHNSNFDIYPDKLGGHCPGGCECGSSCVPCGLCIQ